MLELRGSSNITEVFTVPIKQPQGGGDFLKVAQLERTCSRFGIMTQVWNNNQVMPWHVLSRCGHVSVLVMR